MKVNNDKIPKPSHVLFHDLKHGIQASYVIMFMAYMPEEKKVLTYKLLPIISRYCKICTLCLLSFTSWFLPH